MNARDSIIELQMLDEFLGAANRSAAMLCKRLKGLGKCGVVKIIVDVCEEDGEMRVEQDYDIATGMPV